MIKSPRPSCYKRTRAYIFPCYHLYSQTAHTACLCKYSLRDTQSVITYTKTSQPTHYFSVCSSGMYSYCSSPGPLICRLLSVGLSAYYLFPSSLFSFTETSIQKSSRLCQGYFNNLQRRSDQLTYLWPSFSTDILRYP